MENTEHTELRTSKKNIETALKKIKELNPKDRDVEYRVQKRV